jgi:RNA polymerase sigma factor (TIGR02999 family)
MSTSGAIQPYRAAGLECVLEHVPMQPGDASNGAPGAVTRLLLAWREGDDQAPRELFTLLYEELRGLARGQLRHRRPEESLAPTGLVHEAYVKLADQTRLNLRDRGHFLALAARAMRQILLDHARRRVAQKRGGPIRPGVVDDDVADDDANAEEIIAVDNALERLEALDPRLARIVEARFFAGLSVTDTAAALRVSERTVKRDWQKARAFLYAELHPESR